MKFAPRFRSHCSPALSALAACSLLPALALATQESLSPYNAATVAFDNKSSAVSLADVDGDGFKDAIGFFWGSSKNSVSLKVQRSLGDGTFQPYWNTSLPVGGLDSWGLEPGNFDGDQTADFATAFESIFGGSTVRIYQTVQGSLVPTKQWDEPLGVESLVVADFDGDGLDDIAVAGHGVRMYRNTGSGFQLTSSLPKGTLLQAGEFDSIPGPDLFTVDGDEIKLIPCGGAVMGTSGPHFFTGIAPSMGQHPVAGDIDGDGDDDIVLFSDRSDCVVLRNTDPGGFVAEANTLGGPATRLADIDGDGDLDGLCCGGGGSSGTPYNWLPSNFRISLNDGTGNFALAYEMIGYGAFRLAGADDIDQDGDLDLVAGRAVIFNRGDGFPFDPQPLSGTLEDQVQVLDIDSDGDPDIRVKSKWSGSFSTQINDGAGNFVTVPSSLPVLPGSVYTGPTSEGDFDGDGDADLIVYRWDMNNAFLDMRLMLNLSSGVYVDGGPCSAGDAQFMSHFFVTPELAPNLVADLDGDGDLDVFAGLESFTQDGRIWLNDGAGFFTEAPQIQKLAIASDAVDLDGDGFVDLLGGGYIAYGLGGGGFTAATMAYASSLGQIEMSDTGVAILDFDGDGSLDIASWPGGQFGQNVSVHFQKSARAFQEVQLPFTSLVAFNDVRGRRAIGGDFDGDGDNDILIVSSALDSRIGRFFFNDGVGNFPETSVQMVGLPTFCMDVDGDGDGDLIGKRVTRNAMRNQTMNGMRQQYGQGLPGLGGITPIVGATNATMIGGTFSLLVSGGAGGATAFLGTSLVEGYALDLPVVGASLLIGPIVQIMAFPLTGQLGEAGTGTASMPMTMAMGFSGITFHDQVFILDPASPSGIVSQTGGMRIAIP